MRAGQDLSNGMVKRDQTQDIWGVEPTSFAGGPDGGWGLVRKEKQFLDLEFKHWGVWRCSFQMGRLKGNQTFLAFGWVEGVGVEVICML